jgi:flagellum-specific peptidoglycan hydrolase FlgJ
MIKQIMILCLSVILINCGSSKSVVRTKVDPRKVLVYSKPVKKVVKPTSKPVAKTTPKTTPKTVVKTIPKKPTIPAVKPIEPKKPTAKVVLNDTLKPKSIVIDIVQREEDIKLLEDLEKARETDKSEPEKPVYKKTEVLEATSKVKVTKIMVENYIDRYKNIAKSNMASYGIPASIILAQGILESGSGKGSLSLLANNHFGIKCKTEWTGPSVFFDDDAEQECFRKYNNGEESYSDHAVFLKNRPYYVSLFDLQPDDYSSWAYGLKKAGYATDPKYPNKLIAIIERYNLNQFDAEVLGKAPVVIKPISENLVEDYPLPVESATINKSYQVEQGDTLYSISRKLNIPVPDLIKKNNIENNAISIGQNLIIN